MIRKDIPLRVIQISDTHLYAEPGGQMWGVDVDQGLDAVLTRLKTRHWPADLLLATGDLVQDEGGPAYERFHNFLVPLNVPVYCLPGNHDTPAILDKVLATGLVRRERHLAVGAWQFILLDSTVPNSTGGHLAAQELAFLERALTTHPHHYAMVCLHHQPVASGSAWLDTMRVDNADALFNILDRHSQVRAVVYGHIHQAFAARHRGMDLLSAPSTCVQFKPDSATAQADDLGPGYRWFELYADGTLKTGVERVDTII